jgi:methyl-accepting chemotaxis protein
LITVFSTKLFSEYPVTVAGIGILLLMTSIIRMLNLKKIKQATVAVPQKNTLQVFALCTYISALSWGYLLFFALLKHQIDWQATIVLIMASGIASGAVSSLSPIGKIARIYISLLLLPIVLWGIIDHSYISITFSIISILFMTTLLVNAKDNALWFKANAANVELIRVQSENLRHIMAEIKKVSENLTDSSRHFSELSSGLSNNNETIASRAEEVASSAEAMSASITSISDQMKTTTDSFEVVSKQVENIFATIQNISSNTTATQHASNNTVEVADVVGQKIEELNRILTDVGKFTEIIAEISKTTGLLALNTSIEAARHGGTGNVFGIIAGEIQTLAHQTAVSTAEINGQVREMTAFSKGLVTLVHEVVQNVQNVNANINEIARNIEIQSGTTSEIASRISESSRQFAKIQNIIAQSAAVAETIAKDISTTTAATQGLAKDSTTIKQSSGTLLTLALTLKKYTEKEC